MAAYIEGETLPEDDEYAGLLCPGCDLPMPQHNTTHGYCDADCAACWGWSGGEEEDAPPAPSLPPPAPVDDGQSLAEDVFTFAKQKIFKLLKLTKSKHKRKRRKIKKIIIAAAAEAAELYHVHVDSVEHVASVETNSIGSQYEEPAKRPKLKLQRMLAPSPIMPEQKKSAPEPDMRPVPRGHLADQFLPKLRPEPPKATTNLRGMMSLGKQVVDPRR
jgi:hypothetical protein